MAEQLNFLDYNGLSAFKALLNGVDIVTAEGDGVAYTATIPGVTELKTGLIITINPTATSTSKTPTLDLNGLGAKSIKQRIADNTTLAVEAANVDWMVAGKPVTLQYTGNQWVTLIPRASANSFYGKLPKENLLPGASHTAITVNLPSGSWSSKSMTVTVSGVTATNTVLVSPAPSSADQWIENGVLCTAQGANSLTFTCKNTPGVSLTANVIIMT